MRHLGLNFQAPTEELKKKASTLASGLRQTDFDRKKWRVRVDEEFKIRRLACGEAAETGFLAADSSTATQNLRYHALWGIHCVSLYGLYNGKSNSDPLVGNGRVNYADLMYESYAELGQFKPYRMLEQQMNHLRIAKEYSTLAGDYQTLVDMGRRVDYLLVDGSLKANSENLSLKTELPTAAAALESQGRLLKTRKAVSMAEDSHTSDTSRRFGLEMSNLMLFNLVLEEGEYVVEEGAVNVCYVKLPGKRLGYTVDRAQPTTVRWEFSYPRFEADLNKIASIWLKEDDLLHSQLYPLRIADYLTRRVNAAGMLREAVTETDPEAAFRDLRQV